MAQALRMATTVAPIGPVRVATVIWRYRGDLQLSVLVKAQLHMRNNAAMEVVEPPSIAIRDRHHDDDPTRSLIEASDLVPYRSLADVWLTGDGYAPLGRSVRALVARLGLYRHGTPLLEKTVHLVGSRRSVDDEPGAFESMPIVYERAYGGAGFDPNPVGVGADGAGLPNVLDPADPLRPAGFGPLSRYWKVRRGHLPNEQRHRLEQAVPELPAGFDWTYFQAAPEDQRVPFLHGDEWLVLDGMHPMFMRMQSRLPSVRAFARVLPLQPAGDDLGDAVPLVADTLAIDTGAEMCSVSWRGVLPIASEEILGRMLVAGTLLRRDQSIDWTSAYAAQQREIVVEHKARELVLDRSGVTVVSDAPVPEGVLEELREAFLETTIDEGREMPTGSYRRIADPPSVTEQSVLPSIVLPEDHAAWTDGDSGEVRVRGRIPLGAEVDVGDDTMPNRFPRGPDSDTGELARIPLALDSDFGGPTLPGRADATDTDPGKPPSLRDDELPWVSESAVEPRPPARDPATSLPPAPLNKAELAASLRQAGASEQEIAAIMQSFDEKKPG